MTTPKVGKFTNISHHFFLIFDTQNDFLNYRGLTQAVPNIYLIKISRSQVNIIIFITFLYGEFQNSCRHNDENVGHGNE